MSDAVRRPDPAIVSQFAIACMAFVMIETSWYMVRAACGRRIARYLRSAQWRCLFNRASYGLFLLFGLSQLARGNR